MGGGVIQLAAWGTQNKYLMGNPALTFFKKFTKLTQIFLLKVFQLTSTGQMQIFLNQLFLKPNFRETVI